MHQPEHRGPGGAVAVEDLDHHLVDYRKIIAVLAVATGIEFGISWLMAEHHLGMTGGIVLLVAIAFFKAVLVAKFFMHLRYDPKPLALIAVVPLMLASFIVIIGCFDGIRGPNI